MKDYVTSMLQDWGLNSLNLHTTKWIIAIIGIILILYITKLFCNKLFIPIVKMLTKKTSTKWDDILLNNRVLKDFCSLIPPVILTILVPMIFIEDSTEYHWGIKICQIYIIAIVIRLACSIFSSLYTLTNEHEKLRNHTLQGVFQMLKLIAICIGCIIIISILIDKDPVNILAGLGASAAVLMLVFKDSIMGLVAGVQLSANDMLRPGDWVTLPKHGADGMVVEVTLTTVKIQNWDKTITTIPPYLLVSDSFQNWRGMFDSGGRRIKRSIYIDMNSITFCNKKQMEMFAEKGWLKNIATTEEKPVNLYVFRNYMETYLHNHPGVNQEMILMIRQLQPTPQGLPLELYFFSADTLWVIYEKLQAEVFEHLIAILPEFGLRAFQSPSGRDLGDCTVKIQQTT